MTAYPGYTVDSIQETLSWREIEELMSYWDKWPSNKQILDRIEKILTYAHNVKWEPRVKTEDDILSRIDAFGWNA